MLLLLVLSPRKNKFDFKIHRKFRKYFLNNNFEHIISEEINLFLSLNLNLLKI